MSDHNFKINHSLENRKIFSSKILSKYPDCVPIILSKAKNCNIPNCSKVKFLVPSEITVNKFVFEIRKHIELGSEQAIFLFINNVIPPTSSSIGQIYQHQKDEDGFLYITYTGESTFGSL